MRHDFYLAWHYLRFHKTRTVILIACLSLLAILPAGLHRLLDEGQRTMLARAQSTPLLVGARGSALDLTLNALYFSEAAAPRLSMAESEKVQATGWADAVPVYVRFRVQGHPLVGVTLDYFDFRSLSVRAGDTLTTLGDCVLGADAAASLGLKPGDALLTTPENLFDLAGIYPLKLRVAGVLAKSHSPDDRAVFIDLQTAWILEGLGHGHEAPKASAKPGFGQNVSNLNAAALVTYNEITAENLESFHFHGDPATYPITAVIAVPHDHRGATLLRGRYLDETDPSQIVDPLAATKSLLQNIFRVGALFDAVLLLVGSATLLALGLVFTLSLRLRRRELQTIFLLGCSRLTVVRMVAAEIILIVSASALVCAGLFGLIDRYSDTLIRHFLTS